MTEPEDQNSEEEISLQKKREDMTFAEKVEESFIWVVNMMNEGKVNSKDVYPPGRYHGD